MIIKPIKKADNVYSILPLITCNTDQDIPADKTEAKDTYPVVKKTPSQNKDTIKADLKDKAYKTPIAVATPLPPLNFKNIEKQCPNTATNANIATYLVSNIYLEKYTGRNPFKESSINTRIPAFLPTTLVTLVAPILPLPSFLTSFPKSLPTINPNGIEANRYVNTAYKIKFTSTLSPYKISWSIQNRLHRQPVWKTIKEIFLNLHNLLQVRK